MIDRTPPAFRRRRGEREFGGIPIGSFLGKPNSAQARCLGHFESLCVLIGARRLYMYLLCHLERLSVWKRHGHPQRGGFYGEE